jgi:hypothetical protein
VIKQLFNKVFRVNEKSESEISGSIIVVQLNEKIMPIDRGVLYEDPLDEFLNLNEYGEVTGGGTMQAQNGEIEFCDIEILIYESNNIKKTIGVIIEKLEGWGAPKNSHITIEQTGEQIEFGKKEGLAIYIDGVNLPERVYQDCDSNFVLSELSLILGYDSEVQRYWQGETETALYFYGESFEKMNTLISDFVSKYPLCQGARIVKIA